MVAVISGPVRSAKGVPDDKLQRVISSWQKLALIGFEEDCRGIVQIVEETKSERIWERLGYASIGEFYTEELSLNPEMVAFAYKAVKKEPEKALAWADVPKLGKAQRPTKEEQADKGSNTTVIGRGATYTVARLKRDNPELAQRVIDGELSPNAAAIQAGFRPVSVTISAKTAPAAAAQRIREKLGDDYWKAMLEATQ